MGCDIHAYIEYDVSNSDGSVLVQHFGRVRLGRNYTLFALMAGVRYSANEMDGALPLFEPRGLPKQCSLFIDYDYGLFVNDEFAERDGWCSRESAEKWVARGMSVWLNDKHTNTSNPDYHSASWLTVIELDQVQTAYANIRQSDMSWYQKSGRDIPENAHIVFHGCSPWRFGDKDMDYIEVGERKPLGRHLILDAIIAAMKVLDRDVPGRSRLVFWFDN